MHLPYVCIVSMPSPPVLIHILKSFYLMMMMMRKKINSSGLNYRIGDKSCGFEILGRKGRKKTNCLTRSGAAGADAG